MHYLEYILSYSLTVIGMASVLSTLSPLVVVILCAPLCLQFFVVNRARTADKRENDALAPIWRKLWYHNYLATDCSFGKDVRLYALRDFILGGLAKEQGRRFGRQDALWKIWRDYAFFSAAINFIIEGFLYVWLIWRFLARGISMGDFVMYGVAVRSFCSTMRNLVNSVANLLKQNSLVSDFRSFLDYPDADCAAQEFKPFEGLNSEFEESNSDGLIWGSRLSRPPRLEVEGLCFRYPGQETDALRDINVKIEPGERLAIVGLNGAGKTTFVKLLTRLYEPRAGRVLVDGRSARDYSREEYYSLFSPVFQDIHCFAFSLAENVALAPKGEFDRDRVMDCLERAGLGDKVRSLPQGIDQILLRQLELDGIELSGGECQKLALARALYKDAPVLILDEPTAALDALAEERTYLQFDELSRGKTAIYISHRLASTRFCDRILVFDGGRISEMGSHGELLAAGGGYARLFELQAQYYQEDAGVAL
jgi:ATP-binding cassette subfamily C protein